MIKLKRERQNIIRETEADFTYQDPETNEVKTEKIRVLYYSPTTAQSKDIMEEMRQRQANKDEAVAWYVSDTLVRRLHSLPDLVDENNEPYEITLEFLDSLAADNLNAISDAITEDITAGKPKPAK